jgi:2,3-bisphosphoglycerate-independent phosphoglycerate mutase
MKIKPIVMLLILDGWGFSEETAYNAIASARTPHWDRIWQTYPHCLLSGSGEDVGLPAGQMGNSEVGHVNIGAGRLVAQELSRIHQAVAEGSFAANPVLTRAFSQAANEQRAVHILGLLSSGGIHSHESHIHAAISLAKQQGCSRVYIHAFLDGRDCPPRQAQVPLDALVAHCQAQGCGQLVSMIGRYYAMDRDERWDRIAVAYDLLTRGAADLHASCYSEALAAAYAADQSDEFVKAISLHASDAKPVTIGDGDVVVFMNFRADRARALSRALTQANFSGFIRAVKPKLKQFVTLTAYADDIVADVAFAPEALDNTLGQCLADHGLRQLRIAETEKYAHVTFFFNGGRELPYALEDRILIPSPKVTTYDLQPQMSASELTDALLKDVAAQAHSVIICNYANADMVGHTGNFAATVQAIETLDECLGRLLQAQENSPLEIIITADHGNAEMMYNAGNQQAHTAHTSNFVPFVYIGRKAIVLKTQGTLADIAPTILHILAIAQPAQMTGQSLLAVDDESRRDFNFNAS